MLLVKATAHVLQVKGWVVGVRVEEDVMLVADAIFCFFYFTLVLRWFIDL